MAPNVLFRMTCYYFSVPRPDNVVDFEVIDSSNQVISEVSVDTGYWGEYYKIFRRREVLAEPITINMQVIWETSNTLIVE